MTKLTKTQTKLLLEAQRNPFGRTSTLVTLHTSGRRNRTVGQRERDAASTLRKAGLLDFISSDNYNVYGYGGNCVHCCEALWKITDAGRNLKLEGYQ